MSDAPKKEYYIVEVEGLIHAKVAFRILAENEDDAYKTFNSRPDLATPLHQPRLLPGKVQPKKISIRHNTSGLITWRKRL